MKNKNIFILDIFITACLVNNLDIENIFNYTNAAYVPIPFDR